MKTLEINPVRLSFFRSDLELPSDQPPYFLLGEYDYLSLDAVLDPSVPDGLAEASVLTSYCTPPDQADGKNELSMWLEGKVASGALVRLDFGVTHHPHKNRPWIDDLYKAAISIYGSIGSRGCITLISVGSYSLYVLVNLDLVDLDQAIKKLVSLDIGSEVLVARTTTMPFVSGELLKKAAIGNNCHEASANVSFAEINVSCALFDQHQVINKIKEILGNDEYDLYETLGDYDIRIATRHALPLIKLAGIIHQIRQLPRVRTLTRVATPIAEHTSRISVDFDFPERTFEPVSTRNRELLSKFKWISRRIQASFKDKIAELGQSDLLATLELISKELDRGVDCLSNELANALLDALIEGFMQRGGHRSLPSRDHDLARTDLAFGAFTPLKAIHAFLTVLNRYIASQFKEKARKELELDQDWHGLVVARKSHGFEVFPLSVYLVPYEALLSPCDHDRSWQTLSHELCHVVSSGFLKRPDSRQALVDHVRNLKSPNPKFKIPFEVLMLTLEGDLAEISAHYLDYRLFYQCNFDNYLTAIWATWPQFASESKNNEARYSKYRHYLLRSFAVFVMSFPDKVEELAVRDFSISADWINESRDILKSTIRDFRSRALLLVRNDEVDALLSQDGSDALVLSVARLSPLLKLFMQQVDGVTLPTNELSDVSSSNKEVLEAIVAGKAVLSSFSNPEFLVRDYHLKLLNQRSAKVSVKEQLALMLTFAGVN
jgi:hypothetical protein